MSRVTTTQRAYERACMHACVGSEYLSERRQADDAGLRWGNSLQRYPVTRKFLIGPSRRWSVVDDTWGGGIPEMFVSFPPLRTQRARWDGRIVGHLSRTIRCLVDRINHTTGKLAASCFFILPTGVVLGCLACGLCTSLFVASVRRFAGPDN